MSEIREKLAKGADFSQMAKRFSTCPSGKRAAIWGEFSKGTWSSPSTMPCSRGSCRPGAGAHQVRLPPHQGALSQPIQGDEAIGFSEPYAWE